MQKYHALREELRHSHESGDTLTKAEVMHAVSKGSSAFFSVLEEMANGKVDIVIGTHRLLQKDIAFKNLGLVIIDEEQRFGVGHKERELLGEGGCVHYVNLAEAEFLHI